MTDTGSLLEPNRLWAASEVLSSPSPVPPSPGIYSWWFTTMPPGVDGDRCLTSDGATLLYAGISPKAPPANGRPPRKQNLRSRVRYRYRGNAAGSTLRLTLGSLLSGSLGISLRRVGSGNRLTFAVEGERILSEWMAEHARVAWHVTPEPWIAESAVISTVALPLNLDQNQRHPFHARLTDARATARLAARSLPVVPR